MNVTRWDGTPIAAPGLFVGVPMDDYHGQLTASPSISSSGLRTVFAESPAHYFVDSYLNPDREEQEDSEAFILGRATHHLLLGEGGFERHFAIRPDELNGKAWQGNRTECREWMAAMAADNLTVLKGEHVRQIRGMSASLGAHPMIRAGILNGLIEHSIVWKDEETGVWLKVRPDAIPTDSGDFSDLKTTISVGRDALERTLGDYLYPVQGALIGMASRAVLGRQMQSFTLVFVEKKPPHCVRVVTLKPEDLALGERVIRNALRTFANCLDRGVWPGPGGDQADGEFLEITPWARKGIEGRCELLEQGVAV